LARLPDLLHRGPEAYGFRGQVWTRTRVAEVIRVAFGIRDHPTHVGRLLKALHCSLQQPMRRARQRDEATIARQRDEATIARWRTETWPAIKRGRTRSSR
jgi:transposase